MALQLIPNLRMYIITDSTFFFRHSQTAKIVMLLTFIAVVLCAPTYQPSKHVTCTFTGWVDIYQDIFGGTNTSGWTLNYASGAKISSGKQNPKVSNQWLVLHKSDTKLPNDLKWMPEWNLFTYDSCKISYESKEYAGKTSTGSNGPQHDYRYCAVNFPCEGGIYLSRAKQNWFDRSI